MPQRVGSALFEAAFEPENSSATSVLVYFSSLVLIWRDQSQWPLYIHDLFCFRGRSSTWSCYELTHILLANEWLDKGRELETSGIPRNGLQEVEEKNLWTKLATPDSTQEAVMRLRRGPVSSGMALESQTAGIQGALWRCWVKCGLTPWLFTILSLLWAYPCQLILSLLRFGW